MAASDAESAERAAALAAAEAALSSSGALHAAAIGDAALLLHRLSAAAGRAGGALCPSLRTALAPSSAPLPKALRRATLACHPDRHVGAPVAQQVLAGEIFKLLQGVKAPPPPPPPPAAEAADVAQRAASAVTEQLRTEAQAALLRALAAAHAAAVQAAAAAAAEEAPTAEAQPRPFRRARRPPAAGLTPSGGEATQGRRALFTARRPAAPMEMD